MFAPQFLKIFPLFHVLSTSITEGGGWCYDESSCNARDKYFTSSNGLPQTYSPAGIFAASDVRFQEANLVYTHYCSSDAYGGNGTKSSFDFIFAGREGVRAIIDDLLTTQGLGEQPSAEVRITPFAQAEKNRLA